MEKTVIISGASRGLGRNLAVHCSQSGYNLALIARSQEELESLRDELGKKSAVTIHPCDLTNEGDVSIAFESIRSSHKHIHSLVNCAATWTGGKSVLDLTSEDVERSFQLNFYSAFRCIKETLKIWQEQNCDELHIINAGATASLRGGKNTCAFALAKSSLRILTQSIAREMGPQGVHAVHIILDGLIDNERTRNLNPNVKDENYMKMDAISETILNLLSQDKSAWTLELDLRPYTEKF
ncbi:MAG: SDR family oxidoreductase [Bdellovibrionales bacterium]|nr:SDR family oxidoreductase [Bdellovibrionales bacterium]